MSVKLSVAGVGKDFLIRIIDSVSFEVETGDFVCLLGPNGCGKTTLLRAQGGRRLPGGSPAAMAEPARQPGAGAQPLGVNDAERRARAARYLQMVGLTAFESYYPSRVSGGMRQRAAIEPNVLLMDEPCGLDAQNRRIMQNEVRRIWKETGRTITSSLTPSKRRSPSAPRA